MHADEVFPPTLGSHIVWDSDEDSDEEPFELCPMARSPYEAHLMSKVAAEAKASICTTGTSLATEKESMGEPSWQHEMLSLDARSTSAGEDSDRVVSKSQTKRINKRGRKDSRAKRMRYRRLVDSLICEIASAPEFRVDLTGLPAFITNDVWLMDKLCQRMKKHQEDLQSNIVSL
jgi:hypothetical protein